MYYAFCPDSRLTFQSLDFEVQEEVLDCFEYLLDRQWELSFDADGVAQYEKDVYVGPQRYVIFLDLLVVDGSDKMEILGLAAVPR